MKKLIIVGPNLGMGGVERASSNLANALSLKGFVVFYLALIPKERFYHLNEQVQYIEPIKINKKKIELLNTLIFIRKNVCEIKPTIILTFTKFYSALANMALNFSSYKTIVSERSSPTYRWPIHIEWFCKLSFKLRKPLGVISQTLSASKYHKTYYNGIPNAVIPNAIRQIQKYPELSRKKWILAVGRLNDACKGFDRLMQVINILSFPDDEWKIVFAGGEREEAKYLLDLLKENERKERVEFLGKVKEMDRIYAQAGIFVIPSRSEGFPNALCEAMAAGLPCVSFDFVAGPRDLINNGVNGILVEDGNIAEMANQIEMLMLEPTLRQKLGKSATEIQDLLSYDMITIRLTDFLESIV